MKYLSTRSLLESPAAGAIAKGLAPDGGLFVPAEIPTLTAADLSALCAMVLTDVPPEIDPTLYVVRLSPFTGTSTL